MTTFATHLVAESAYPVRIVVEPALDHRNRLTTAFRILLAIPHLILVGGPMALALTWSFTTEAGLKVDWGGAGVLGAVAAAAALIAWFAILFTGRYPAGLYHLATYYLRWRVRAAAYTALLRDEYPPFGDAPYPARLDLLPADGPRDRVTVAFRILLALPHILAVWVLGVAWAFCSIIAWLAILFTGRYPAGLYEFAVHVLQWNVRVEAYLLLLRDEYPPFSFEA